MCVERLEKLLLAIVMGISMMLVATGSIKAGFLLQFGTMVILILSSFTGFCFITKILESVFPPCRGKDKS